MGDPKRFVERVCESYTSVEVKNVRGRLQNKIKLILIPFQLTKYFLSYIYGPVDHSKKVYSRKRTFTVDCMKKYKL